MKRLYHHYTEWEEFHSGMWTNLPPHQEDALLTKAIEFTGDAPLYGSHMLRVLDEWPISCEQNLSDTSRNRQAWIGHAAAWLAIECPEHVTRRAWWFLSQEQRDLANAQADAAIKLWEQRNEAAIRD